MSRTTPIQLNNARRAQRSSAAVASKRIATMYTQYPEYTDADAYAVDSDCYIVEQESSPAKPQRRCLQTDIEKVRVYINGCRSHSTSSTSSAGSTAGLSCPVCLLPFDSERHKIVIGGCCHGVCAECIVEVYDHKNTNAAAEGLETIDEILYGASTSTRNGVLSCVVCRQRITKLDIIY